MNKMNNMRRIIENRNFRGGLEELRYERFLGRIYTKLVQSADKGGILKLD